MGLLGRWYISLLCAMRLGWTGRTAPEHPIISVASNGLLELVTFYAERWRGSVHAKDSSRRTPLICAAAEGHVTVPSTLASTMLGMGSVITRCTSVGQSHTR
eukprot:31455-Eustigmatos_ZCMA.PRE.1